MTKTCYIRLHFSLSKIEERYCYSTLELSSIYNYCLFFVLSCFICVRLFVTLWTVVRQAPLSMGFSRQECWGGLPRPPPGDLLAPGIKPTSLMSPAVAGRFFTTSTTWEPCALFTGGYVEAWSRERKSCWTQEPGRQPRVQHCRLGGVQRTPRIRDFYSRTRSLMPAAPTSQEPECVQRPRFSSPTPTLT